MSCYCAYIRMCILLMYVYVQLLHCFYLCFTYFVVCIRLYVRMCRILLMINCVPFLFSMSSSQNPILPPALADFTLKVRGRMCTAFSFTVILFLCSTYRRFNLGIDTHVVLDHSSLVVKIPLIMYMYVSSSNSVPFIHSSTAVEPPVGAHCTQCSIGFPGAIHMIESF